MNDSPFSKRSWILTILTLVSFICIFIVAVTAGEFWFLIPLVCTLVFGLLFIWSRKHDEAVDMYAVGDPDDTYVPKN